MTDDVTLEEVFEYLKNRSEREMELMEPVRRCSEAVFGDHDSNPSIPGLLHRQTQVETTLYGDMSAVPPQPGLLHDSRDIKTFVCGIRKTLRWLLIFIATGVLGLFGQMLLSFLESGRGS